MRLRGFVTRDQLKGFECLVAEDELKAGLVRAGLDQEADDAERLSLDIKGVPVNEGQACCDHVVAEDVRAGVGRDAEITESAEKTVDQVYVLESGRMDGVEFFEKC